VAQSFASKEVTVVTKENQGAGAARNYALKLSQGDFIQWLDADDLLAPDKIDRQLMALRETDGKRVLLSSAWAYFGYRTKRAGFIRTSSWQDLSPMEWMMKKMEQHLCMQTATWLTNRHPTEAAGSWDTSLLTDDETDISVAFSWHPKGRDFYPERPDHMAEL
jgi:glycosyltransferase involved in cell wall biosynthesis